MNSPFDLVSLQVPPILLLPFLLICSFSLYLECIIVSHITGIPEQIVFYYFGTSPVNDINKNTKREVLFYKDQCPSIMKDTHNLKNLLESADLICKEFFYF